MVSVKQENSEELDESYDENSDCNPAKMYTFMKKIKGKRREDLKNMSPNHQSQKWITANRFFKIKSNRFPKIIFQIPSQKAKRLWS